MDGKNQNFRGNIIHKEKKKHSYNIFSSFIFSPPTKKNREENSPISTLRGFGKIWKMFAFIAMEVTLPFCYLERILEDIRWKKRSEAVNGSVLLMHSIFLEILLYRPPFLTTRPLLWLMTTISCNPITGHFIKSLFAFAFRSFSLSLLSLKYYEMPSSCFLSNFAMLHTSDWWRKRRSRKVKCDYFNSERLLVKLKVVFFSAYEV